MLFRSKGRSLEEIDEIFLRSESVLDSVRVAKELPMGLDVLDTIEASKKADRLANEDEA